MRGRAVGSTLIVVTLGSLLHFAWSWSGRSPIVAVFAATNESTWEHLAGLLAALGLAILAFATLSFQPPSCFLFAEPD